MFGIDHIVHDIGGIPLAGHATIHVRQCIRACTTLRHTLVDQSDGSHHGGPGIGLDYMDGLTADDLIQNRLANDRRAAATRP